ncbi:MAG TPA: hypothetical protein VNB22_00385 [Pyrinomonadaceae bacterium]|jgi:hypothetical protein|nr:hypothetical protein [Pyrinomonadaceae bacterium]
MSGESGVLKTGIVIFPMKRRELEVSEVKSIKIEETTVTEIKTVKIESRFARLKKSLQKGSKSIL